MLRSLTLLAAFVAPVVLAAEGKWTPQQVLQQGPAWVKLQGFALPLAKLWDEKTQTVNRILGSRKLKDDADLQKSLRDGKADWERAGKPETPVTIDAHKAVPCHEVLTVMNLCKRENIDSIGSSLGCASID